MHNTFKIIKRSIHNQSYISLQNKYKNIIKENKNYNIINTELNNKIQLLQVENKKLIEKNKKLDLELFEKTKFYNLNLHKIQYF